MGKGKEEEGTEPGLCDTGLFSAGLEAADTGQGSSKTSGGPGLEASLGRTVDSRAAAEPR